MTLMMVVLCLLRYDTPMGDVGMEETTAAAINAVGPTVTTPAAGQKAEAKHQEPTTADDICTAGLDYTWVRTLVLHDWQS